MATDPLACFSAQGGHCSASLGEQLCGFPLSPAPVFRGFLPMTTFRRREGLTTTTLAFRLLIVLELFYLLF